ncbi:MAG: response regulator [Candidatus Adiutrix sp.]
MSGPDKILIVDDDCELCELLSEVLGSYGYESVAVDRGTKMYEALAQSKFSLILLDIMMPGEDGLALCRTLKAPFSKYSSIPIIFLTALKDTSDTVVGLEIGGDDYLCKPFQTRELIARIRAVLRRGQAMGGASLANVTSTQGSSSPSFDSPHVAHLSFATWKLNVLARHLIDENGIVVPLSAAEFRLISLFLAHPQQVISRERIMNHLAERNLNIYDRSIDSQISRLRAKLRDRELNIIRTMRGDGYMLATPVARCFI